MKYRISVTDENYRRMEWYEMMSEWVKTFATKQEAREQIAEWREFDEAEGNFYHYGIDEVFEHQYKLDIHIVWNLDVPNVDAALEEIQTKEPQIFEALQTCRGVVDWEVSEDY